MNYEVRKDKLFHQDGVEYIPSLDHGGDIEPEAIVLHYTAGGSAQSDVNWLTMKDEVYVSAHLVIGRAGEVTQLVPFNKRAFHAGRSSWKGKTELNKWSIGIEFSNWGKLRRSTVGIYLSWSNVQIDKDLVVRVGDTYWERFYPEQLEAGREVCKALLDAYSIRYILGHYEVSPGRKIDPGAAFHIEDFRPNTLRSEDTFGRRLINLEKRVDALEADRT